MQIPKILLFTLAVSMTGLVLFGQAGPLANKGKLILSSPFAGSLEQKELVDVKKGWQRRISFGEWTLQPDGSLTAINIPEDGHGPVLTFLAPIRDVVIECEFTVPAGVVADRHFRIFLDHPDYRGHTIQSTANLSSTFRPVGLTLQHISKGEDKKTIEDIEFGPTDLDIEPGTWYKMRLDLIGDQAWTIVNGVRLSGRNKVLDVEKSKIGLNPGKAGGSIRNFRVWKVWDDSDAAEIEEALKEINNRFKKVEVQLIEWPDEVYPKLGNIKRLAFLAQPENQPVGKLPLVISLHGAGGKEMSLRDQLVRSSKVKGLALAELAGKDMILIEPNSYDSWDADTLDHMLDYLLRTNGVIDKSRVYVMGHSMGGSGTWNWILKSADRFAAAAPCGFSGGTNPKGIEKLVDLPIWGMVGGNDGKNVAAIQTMTENLRAAGNDKVKHSAFPGANHAAGNAAVFSSVDLVDWMLSH